MRFSLELPTQHVDRPGAFLTVEAITEITRAARAAGFEAVNVTDHPAPDARWLDHGGHHALDPFVALGVAAAADPDIRLQTNVYVAPYRNPFLGAKSVHSLHVLSGERLILGVAAGYLKPEFAALGVDFEGRGALLDEALDVLDAVCTGEDVAWESARARARGVRFRPVPGRRPPIWVGGNSPAARRRAGRYEGWAPFHTAGFARTSRTTAIESTEELAAAIAEVRGLAGAGGRRAGFDVCWSAARASDPDASADERCAHVAELERIGVTWMTVRFAAADRSAYLEELERFGREVIAEVGGET
ncbi:MAG TPA: TIGR03619 family F420-dependent LLM class oxidoreductase [Acidimicrobiales bacterium]|nr:TIGR03619 family F420-dependent LLM class oxidoreductase [Acidimicrobiales bacterium]